MPEKTLNEVLTNLTAKELAAIEEVAKQRGISVEEAASQLVAQGIANRVKRNTGSTPAKVYSIGRRS